MTKTTKKDEKKLLLRLSKGAFSAVKRAAEASKRSINSEIAFAIEDRYIKK